MSSNETRSEARRILAHILIGLGVTDMDAITPDVRAKIGNYCRMVEPGADFDFTAKRLRIEHDFPDIFPKDAETAHGVIVLAYWGQNVGAELGLVVPPAPSWVAPGAWVWCRSRGRIGLCVQIVSIDDAGYVTTRICAEDADFMDAPIPMGWFFDRHEPIDETKHRAGRPCPTCGTRFPDNRICVVCATPALEANVARLVAQMEARSA